MSKDEYIAILDTSFDHGTPFINITEFYSFALIPLANGNWLNCSYDFEEKSLIEKKEINATSAFNQFCEEVEKGMSEAVEDFMLFKWKEFKKTLTGSEGDKLKAGINELISKASEYSKNLPVVLKKEDLAKVKAKL